jgi:small GTP-binding protein
MAARAPADVEEVRAVPMPHRVQMQLIKRRLVGKEGSARIKELRSILTELPDYKNGPYADIRKWVLAEIHQTRGRSKVVHRDSIAVRREGVSQIALVGPPNVGKSSLLQALSRIQIKTGDYAFTTLRPVPALTLIKSVPVQIVELPGLIGGAAEDRGGGRALLGVLRGADGIVYCHDASAPVEPLLQVRAEVIGAGIDLPSILAATKSDEVDASAIERLRTAFSGTDVLAVSVLDDESLRLFRDAVWRLTGLIRVFTRRPGSSEADPMALEPGATVAEVAAKLHNDLRTECRGARVWGPSAKFDGQRVGREHVVEEDDVLEVIV